MYDKDAKQIDVMALLRETGKRESERHVRAFVLVDGRAVAGRLCWVRLPLGKAQQARRRAEKESDRVCDDDTLLAAEFVIVFTTILTELTARQVLELYRARWQVELEFKRAKSIRELDRLPNFLPETIHSWICAKLLLQLISARIANASESLSDAFPPGGCHLALLPAAPTTDGRAGATNRRGTLVHGAPGLGRRVRGVAAAQTA